MEGLGINLGYLFVQIFSFLILFVVLRAWVFGPITQLLTDRRERIAQGLEDARVAEEARQNAEKEADQILAEAQQKANQRVREATERAEEAAREVRTEAEGQAREILDSARHEAEQVRQEALGELRGQMAAMVMAAAQKVIGDGLDEGHQRRLIDEFFSGVRSGQVVVVEGEDLQGQSAEVTSAVPLTEQEKERVRENVISKMGGDASVSFTVDPDILGGLIVRVGDRVLDGSVAGKLDSMRQSLR